jgi:hypothetical protein
VRAEALTAVGPDDHANAFQRLSILVEDVSLDPPHGRVGRCCRGRLGLR